MKARKCTCGQGAGQGPQLTTSSQLGPLPSSRAGHAALTVNEQECFSFEASANFCLQTGCVASDVSSLHPWPLVTVLSHSVVSDSLWPHGLQPARLLCPWGFSRKEYWSGLPCPPHRSSHRKGIRKRAVLYQINRAELSANSGSSS